MVLPQILSQKASCPGQKQALAEAFCAKLESEGIQISSPLCFLQAISPQTLLCNKAATCSGKLGKGWWHLCHRLGISRAYQHSKGPEKSGSELCDLPFPKSIASWDPEPSQGIRAPQSTVQTVWTRWWAQADCRTSMCAKGKPTLPAGQSRGR